MNRSLFESASPSVACVDVPAFPLQLVLREHPEWSADPVVVVEEDRPLAEILWANRPARERRIRRGMKFAQAQSLVARLHGEVVAPERVASEREQLLRLFTEVTPHVEPEEDAPGLFWLDPTGLATLYGGLETWAQRVHREVTARGFVAAVAAGWRRGSCLAIARTRPGVTVLPDPETERRLAAPVPLASLALSPSLLEAMAVLDVKTFGEFVALPAAGLRLRYGEEAARLHDVASGHAWTPLRPHRFRDPARAEIPIDPPDDDHARLLFGIKGVLHRLLDGIADRDEGVTALRLTLELDHGPPHEERIEAASPTLVAARLLDLVRLRLDVLRLPAPVERIVLTVESRPVSPRQADWMPSPGRDRARDAVLALARVRAAFGEESVVRARLVDACLPEARYRWEPLHELPPPDVAPDAPGLAPLVRGVLPRPLRLPSFTPERTDDVTAFSLPGRVCTGWWDAAHDRDYRWVETAGGEILWVFRERTEDAWYLHGVLD